MDTKDVLVYTISLTRGEETLGELSCEGSPQVLELREGGTIIESTFGKLVSKIITTINNKKNAENNK